MTLRGLDQNFECAEKHLEFAIENSHEILEKLDYLNDDVKHQFIKQISTVNNALRDVYSEILMIKYKIRHDDESEVIKYIKEKIPILRKKLRISRKVYQQLKEYFIDKLSDKNNLLYVSAMIGEIADGRGNIYAVERHLTEVYLDLLKRVKIKKVVEQ